MKKLLLIVLLVLPFTTFCQEQKLPRTEQYCMVLATSRLLSSKVSITVDFGQETSMWRAEWIKDEEGKIVKFNTVIDALNYMNAQGWEYVNAYAITLGNQNVYHYVMKRKITPEILREMTENAEKNKALEKKRTPVKDDVYN